jgi:hypothetical protein
MERAPEVYSPTAARRPRALRKCNRDAPDPADLPFARGEGIVTSVTAAIRGMPFHMGFMPIRKTWAVLSAPAALFVLRGAAIDGAGSPLWHTLAASLTRKGGRHGRRARPASHPSGTSMSAQRVSATGAGSRRAVGPDGRSPTMVATEFVRRIVKGPEAAVIHKALVHGIGAALVAAFSYVTASRIPIMHEPYWASIAAVVSLYPERDATMKAGVQQFFGSALGGLIGWASASWWHHNVFLYAAAVLLAVSVCHLVHLPNSARLSGVAVTIITLIPFSASPAAVALRRFTEVTYGVACAIGYTAAVACVARLRFRLARSRGRA